MVDAHRALAVAVLAGAVIAAFVGGYAYWRRREVGRIGSHLLALAQTLIVAQVGVGLLLLSDDRRAADQLHYIYGTLSLGAVLTPWFYAPAEPRRRLGWFAACSALAAALAVRAFMTGS